MRAWPSEEMGNRGREAYLMISSGARGHRPQVNQLCLGGWPWPLGTDGDSVHRVCRIHPLHTAASQRPTPSIYIRRRTLGLASRRPGGPPPPHARLGCASLKSRLHQSYGVPLLRSTRHARTPSPPPDPLMSPPPKLGPVVTGLCCAAFRSSSGSVAAAIRCPSSP